MHRPKTDSDNHLDIFFVYTIFYLLLFDGYEYKYKYSSHAKYWYPYPRKLELSNPFSPYDYVQNNPKFRGKSCLHDLDLISHDNETKQAYKGNRDVGKKIKELDFNDNNSKEHDSILATAGSMVLTMIIIRSKMPMMVTERT